MAERDEGFQSRDALIASLQTDFNDKDRQLASSESKARNLQTSLDEARNENQRLDAQLNSMAAALESMRADYQTLAATVDRQTQSLEEARTTSMTAAETRDESVRAKEKAVAHLRDAQNEIASLNAAMDSLRIANADLTDTNRSLEIIVAAARTELGPGWIASAQPSLDGTVRHVDSGGRLLTVAITANPASADVKPGYRFAVYDGETYKGEAMITDVDGNFAFCRVTVAAGPEIKIGDRASTRTN